VNTSEIQIEQLDNGVAVLRLQRPEKRNALNQALRQAVIDSLTAIEADDGVSAVVLTGAGGTFCAGFDLDELMASSDQAALFAHSNEYHRAVHTFPKPIVAAVEGAAVAGGMDLAMMCDVRVAARGARFGQPQVKMGVPASFELLRSLTHESAARDLCLTGRLIDAATAADLGIVDRVVETGQALDAATALASEIAASAGSGLMKRAFVAAQPSLFVAADPATTGELGSPNPTEPRGRHA
jgi:enoyl-CoA hydratase